MLPASAIPLQDALLYQLDHAKALIETMASLAKQHPRRTDAFEAHAKALGASLEAAGDAARRFFWVAECDGEA